MNREILFRGKLKENNEWVEGILLNFRKNTYIVPHDCVYYCDGTEKFVFDIAYFEVLPETVGQYTGLTDKNGMKIFESDIIKTKKYGKISDYIIINGFDTFAVIYKPCMFRLVNRNRRFNFVNIRRDQLEVVGNVHDNPELMEVK